MDLLQDESDDNISQSISHTNESNKDNLDFMHIDSDNFSNIELEIMAKKQSEDSNDIYVIESTDSFYETEESEEEMNKPEMIDGSLYKKSNKKRKNASWVWEHIDKKPPTKEWKKIGKCAVLIPGKKGDKEKFKKCGVEIHTQESTTNFASHLLTHGIVKPQLAIKKVNNSQSKIDIIFKKTTTNNTNRKEAINQALVEFIIEDSQPFYLLKSHAFIKLINLLDPFYELPSDKFIKTLIHQAFFYSTNKLKALFAEELISCNLTCDLWTARSRSSYLGITCHFINLEFKLNEVTLAMCYVPYPHDSETIVTILEEVIENWGLKNKVDHITSNNAANMIKAINLLKNIDRIPCAAHTLQLVIGKGLKPAEILVIRTKRLINFLLSPKQTERLTEAQKVLRITEDEINKQKVTYIRVIADVSTRWNSLYISWKRLLQLRKALDIMLATMNAESDNNTKKDAKRLHAIMLSNDEWRILEQLTNLLTPFAEATTLLGGSTYSTISFMLPAIRVLLQNCKPRLIDHSDDQIEDEIENMNFDDITTIFDNEEIVIDYDYNDEVEITANAKKVKVNQFVETNGLVYKVKNALYEALKYYWKLPLESSLIATFLDPRCKRMDKFYEWEREQAIEAVRDLVQKHANQDKTYSKHTDTNINNKLLNLMFGNQEQLEHDKVDLYLEAKEISYNANPFTWWDNEKARLPILSNLAQKYLSIPATSTASERLFSDSGNIISTKRTQLNEILFERILFLKHNMNIVEQIFPPL